MHNWTSATRSRSSNGWRFVRVFQEKDQIVSQMSRQITFLRAILLNFVGESLCSPTTCTIITELFVREGRPFFYFEDLCTGKRHGFETNVPGVAGRSEVYGARDGVSVDRGHENPPRESADGLDLDEASNFEGDGHVVFGKLKELLFFPGRSPVLVWDLFSPFFATTQPPEF